MGFLKSLSTLSKQAKEIDRAAPPMEVRLGALSTKMQETQAMMAQQTAASLAAVDPGAVVGEAQILALRNTGTMVSSQPSIQLDLLVMLPAMPPYPATITMVVPTAELGRLTPGATVAVRVNPATPELVHIA
jgi:hypothetical protein